MGFYERNVMPWMISKGMQNKAITKHRPRIPPLASKRVLEIGMGSGLNIPYYTGAVEHLFGLEPSEKLIDEARGRAADAPFPVEFIASPAEHIPLEAGSIDTIVSTWTMCSIPGIEEALSEMRRVLKPDGKLLFIEHGRAPDENVAKWQDRLTPLFKAMAGCRPNRAMDKILIEAGFAVPDIDMNYLDGPRFISYHYIGEATPR